MGHRLELHFPGRHQLRLKLSQNGGVLDTLDFSFQGDLDTVLLEGVDKFLKKNRIDLLTLGDISVTGDIDEESSAYKVAHTWIAAVKFRR